MTLAPKHSLKPLPLSGQLLLIGLLCATAGPALSQGQQTPAQQAARALADLGIDDIAVCGLAKKLEEIWLPDDDYPVIMKRQSEGLYLMQRVRDESHRFAISYHRKKRSKGSLRSALDDIDGVGLSYQRKLLNHFGSLKAIKAASLDDLQEVKGIGKAKASAIYSSLHQGGRA